MARKTTELSLHHYNINLPCHWTVFGGASEKRHIHRSLLGSGRSTANCPTGNSQPKKLTVEQRGVVAAAAIVLKLTYIAQHAWPSTAILSQFTKMTKYYVWHGTFARGRAGDTGMDQREYG
ncbi:hypothetical protein CCR75_008093 [Bremia lactucae]|uniref:Uncharacterized protein n=1 Tax=Bremia lactucae TaxID=4779 RepID=A0A976FJX5_BRELC|nr:hypothetical protein CCR75_008093 [Bremia lactucae]